MAPSFNLSALAKLLLPLLLLTSLLTANAAKPRRPRKRQANPSPTPSPNANCQDPPEAELKRRLGEEMSHPYALHQSFYQHQGLRNGVGEYTLESFKAGKKGPVNIQTAPLDRTSRRNDCGPVERRTPEGVVRDPCPITWVINVDINRVPRVLVEGQCQANNCTSCALMGQQQESRNVSVIVRTSCQPVYYYTRVLRKTKDCDLKKKFLYASVWERITVGCACRGEPSRSTADGNGRDQSAKSSQH